MTKVTYDYNHCSVDRFTQLPDAITHHIFSFLEKNDMFRLCMASKRCRDLTLSSPYINLASGKSDKRKLSNFVDRYLLQHRNRKTYFLNHDDYCNQSRCSSITFKSFLDKYRSERGKDEINSFHLQWFRKDCPCYAEGRSLLDAWLHQLVECKVQELSLDIDFNGKDESYIPGAKKPKLHTFNYPEMGCKFLRVLEIDLNRDKIRLPLKVFACLETLSLNSSNFDSTCSIGEWISTYCPSLKKLSLVSINGMLKLINHSMTEVMLTPWGRSCFISVSGNKLQVMSLYLPSGLEKDSHVKVSAPKLNVLKWEGGLPQKLKLGKFNSLTDATLNICGTYMPGEPALKPFVKLLSRVKSAKALRLHISMLETVFVRHDLQIQFENLQKLKIMNCIRETNFGYHIPVISHFLTMTLPNLRFLTIDCNKNHDSVNDYEHVMHDLLRSRMTNKNQENVMNQNPLVISQMKEVRIRLSGCEHNKRSNGILVVKYFLDSIVGYEKLTILYPPSFYYELPSFLGKEVKLASSNVDIVTMLEEQEEADL